MIVLDFQNPRNTFDCPFLEEDYDNELYCYFNPDINARCVGLYNSGCHIVRLEIGVNVDAREGHDCFEERYKNVERREDGKNT